MTYRVYVRWPDQRVSNKTSTPSEAVARAAFDELMACSTDLRRRGAVGLAMSHEGRQVHYVDLRKLDEGSAG